MEFRWAAAIALWTMLAGPVIAPPPVQSSNFATRYPGIKSQSSENVRASRF